MTGGGVAEVTVGDAPLRVRDVVAVAHGARATLAPSALERIRRSRHAIEERLAAEEPTYGLNRGLGHNKNRKIPADELARFSLSMLRAHEGGLGPPLPAPVVRAATLVRICGIAQGGAGATPAMPETLVAMLNAGVTPIVPSTGSVGAGDLSPMASIGLVAIGEGRAEYRGEPMSGGEALRRAGIEPFVLGPKDGLTLMSANGISIGQAALVAARIQQVAALADTVAALSLEGVGASPSVIDPAVGDAKPIPGQVESAAHMRAVLQGSYLLSRSFESVQEALSFRVVPQVHGTLREVADFAMRAVETELNSAADNPLVTPDGRIVHNGNFEPLLMAVAFDAVRIALAHVGQLSDRRMSHLWDATFKSMQGPPDPDRAYYGIKLRYPVAARYIELRQLAAPATLDVPILDIGVEDHATGAPLSVSQTDMAVRILEEILTGEVLLVRDLLSASPNAEVQLGSGTGGVVNEVETAIRGLGAGAHPAEVHAAIREALAP